MADQSVALAERVPPLVTMRKPPGPLSPAATWPALTEVLTTQGLAPEMFSTTLFVLLATAPPVQLALSVHKPLPDGLAAGFQTVVVSCASAHIVAPRSRAAVRGKDCFRNVILLPLFRTILNASVSCAPTLQALRACLSKSKRQA